MAVAPKDIHGLVLLDISPDDRQNYKSLEKVMEDRVINSLKKYVIGSEATIAYIIICKNVTSSFLDTELDPIERIYRIWNAVFLLRIWNSFIKKSEMFNVDDNFISHNAHNCIELNAIGLTQLIVKLRNSESSEMFIPNLFDSQPCERTFRQLRSLGTINYIKINFTLMELLHLVSRIELQNDIVYEKLFNIIEFPRMSNSFFNARDKAKSPPRSLPSNNEIAKTIKKALLDANQTGIEFGMSSEESRNLARDLSQFIECPLKKLTNQKQRIAAIIPESSPEDKNDSSEDETRVEHSLINRSENMNLRNYNTSSDNITLDENSKYIHIFDPDGTSKVVLKSSIVGLLSETTGKLSSDRLKRVQTTPLDKVTNRVTKRQKKHQRSETYQDFSENVYINSNEIKIGDWCFFSFDSNTINTSILASIASNIPKENVIASVIDSVVFGCILAFKFRNGKNEKERQYHKDDALTFDVINGENTKS